MTDETSAPEEIDEKAVWQRVLELMGDRRFQVGPVWSRKLRANPRNLALAFSRTKFAAKLACVERKVLELGCGEGIPSVLLAEQASDYVGVDASAEAIAAARTAWEGQEGMRFLTEAEAQAEELNGFAAVVCLQGAGGLDAAATKALVERASSALEYEGVFVIGAEVDALDASLQGELSAGFRYVLPFAFRGTLMSAGAAESGGFQVFVACLKRQSAAEPIALAPALAEVEGQVTFGAHGSYLLYNTPRRTLYSTNYYGFASSLLGKGRVLDIGCGEGLGTWLLAAECGYAKGVDFDEPAIEAAKLNWPDPRVEFLCGDAHELPKTERYDAVVNFDVIEHIDPESADDFLAALRDMLTTDGMVVIGTPNITSKQYASAVTNAGHINLYSGARMEAALSRLFRYVMVFSANDELIHTGFHPMAHYIIGVGCGPK
tara:strand:- start:4316 stop:5614 length:1299 start_codon:yes stop_codon:yes gene_type:complete